jgi:putative intracellular protease/amidase
MTPAIRLCPYLIAPLILCGLVTVALAQPAPARHKVAVLIFNGAEIIDYAGPYEVFGAESDQFEIYTVASTAKPVVTGAGMTVLAQYSYLTAPPADVVIIPGGMIEEVEHDRATLDWIKAQAAHARFTMSVCNGAFILANTGLLDGLTATTTRQNIPILQAQHPQIKVVRDQRLEYDASHQHDYLPGTFAINVLPDVGPKLAKLGDWSTLRTQGDAKHWELSEQAHSQLGLAALEKQVQAIFRDTGHWTATSAPATDSAKSGLSYWSFKDANGAAWRASVDVRPSGTHAGQFVLAVAVTRAG